MRWVGLADGLEFSWLRAVGAGSCLAALLHETS